MEVGGTRPKKRSARQGRLGFPWQLNRPHFLIPSNPAIMRDDSEYEPTDEDDFAPESSPANLDLPESDEDFDFGKKKKAPAKKATAKAAPSRKPAAAGAAKKAAASTAAPAPAPSAAKKTSVAKRAIPVVSESSRISITSHRIGLSRNHKGPSLHSSING